MELNIEDGVYPEIILDEIKDKSEPYQKKVIEAYDWMSWFLLLRIMRGYADKCNILCDEWKNAYDAYIASDTWRDKANILKQEFDNRCQVCNTSDEETILAVHHRTYERLGCELKKDLVVLCKNCHYHFHFVMNKPW